MEGTEREKKIKEQAYNFGISGISKRECEKIVAFFIFYPLSLFDIKKSSPLTRHPRQRVCSNEDYQEVAKARQASPCHELCGTKPTFQNHYCLPHLPPPKNIAKVYGNGKTKRYFFRVAPIGL